MESSAKKVKVPRYSWAVLAMLYLAAASAPLNMFKVAALAPMLIEELAIPITDIGILMSVFNIAGLILALPAGFLVQRMGVKPAILLAVGVTAIGSIVGVFALGFGILALSRTIEGIGFGLLGVGAPSGISNWFPKERRGLPLGVFTTWVPLGNLITLSFTPTIAGTAGWQGAWWFGAGACILMFIVVALFFRMPNEEEAFALHGEEGSRMGRASKEEAKAILKGSYKVLRNGRIWLLGIVFAVFNMAGPGGVVNFFATYLEGPIGLPLALAGIMTAVSMLGVCIFEPLSGWISDKVGSRKVVMLVPAFGLIVTSFFIFNPAIGFVGVWVVMILHISMFCSGISVGTYASAPEMAGRPEFASMAMGMVALCQNVGLLLGPIMLSNVLTWTGGDWVSVGYFWLVPVAVVVAALTCLLKPKAVMRHDVRIESKAVDQPIS